MPAFYKYADEAADWPGSLVHVTVEYQTNAGSPGAWSRWVHHFDTTDDDLNRAIDFAVEHVRGFKRVLKINGGSAMPYRKGA